MERKSEAIITETSRIKMGRAEFCAVMFKLWGKKTMIVLSNLLVVSLILGIRLDIRFFIVTLMIIFIIAPMILGFMYYYYGLGERCYFNVTDHTLVISEDGIQVSMYFPEYVENEDEISEVEPVEKCIEKLFEFRLFHRYHVRGNSVIFPLGERKIDGFLWLPESAFETSEEFAAAVKLLSSHINITNY